MPPNIKRVFYVNNVAAPVFLDILATRPDIQVDRLENDTPDVEAEPVLARAHIYQIGSSRQELAMRFQGYAPLLRRCPNLLVLSTTGAGFDTLSLADATEAGIAVVNQAGGNKEGVAEHVLGMMLALSKRIVTADHIMRRDTPYHRRDFMGDDIQGRTIGIIGIGHVGTRVAELCRGLFQMRVLAYDPLPDRRADRGARRREGGGAGRPAAPVRLCLGQLPAHRGNPRDDGRGAVRTDAAARLFHHHHPRRHP
jgi:D-3-phosphoglycerate dehydrogenase